MRRDLFRLTVRQQFFFPLGLAGLKFFLPVGQGSGGLSQLLLQVRLATLLVSRRGGENGSSLRVTAAAGHRSLVEERKKLVIFLLSQRVILVIMTPAAIERQAEPDGAHRFGHIHDVVDSILFRNAAAFAVDHVVATETGCQCLFRGGVGQQITGQLQCRKLVKRDVVVECRHDPVAPRPHRTFAVALIAVAVGVTCCVQPFPRHAFAVGVGT